MKYLKTGLIMMFCLTLCGCGFIDGFNAANSLSIDSGQEEIVSEDNSGQSDEEENEIQETEEDVPAYDEFITSSSEQADKYKVVAGMASVGYEAGTYTCDRCGEVLREYYIETVQLTDMEIPYVEQFNEFIREKQEGWIAHAQDWYDAYGDDYLDDCDWHYLWKTEIELEGVTRYVFESGEDEEQFACLELDYYQYVYTGGAHGVPIKFRYLFNLEDGSEITIEDICNVSEEEFRRLAAEYTVKDYQTNDDRYYETDEESLYDMVYGYINFNSLLRLGSEGVIIEHYPYNVGPYGSWFIEITIPYEDLGMRLVEIRGSNGAEELIEDEEIFMSFLNGETDAIFEEDFQSDLSYICVERDYDYDTNSYSHTYAFDPATPLSYAQLTGSVEEEAGRNHASGEIEKSYAILNTVSGKQILAVKYENLGIYSPNDTSDAVFFFAVNDGQLYMTYAYDSWARSYVYIYGELIIRGAGSAGAGDHFTWGGFIDETGHYQMVYEAETLAGYYVSMYSAYTYGMGWRSDGCGFILMETPDEYYYWYEVDDYEDPVDFEKLDAFIDYLEADGMTEIDSVGDAINEAFESAGITYDSDIPAFDGWILLD